MDRDTRELIKKLKSKRKGIYENYKEIGKKLNSEYISNKDFEGIIENFEAIEELATISLDELHDTLPIRDE